MVTLYKKARLIKDPIFCSIKELTDFCVQSKILKIYRKMN
jgi:hypothetical protein